MKMSRDECDNRRENIMVKTNESIVLKVSARYFYPGFFRGFKVISIIMNKSG